MSFVKMRVSIPQKRLPQADDAPFLDATRDSIPLRRFGRPEEIAEGALYLASDDSAYVTGQLLGIDGGFSGFFVGSLSGTMPANGFAAGEPAGHFVDADQVSCAPEQSLEFRKVGATSPVAVMQQAPSVVAGVSAPQCVPISSGASFSML